MHYLRLRPCYSLYFPRLDILKNTNLRRAASYLFWLSENSVGSHSFLNVKEIIYLLSCLASHKGSMFLQSEETEELIFFRGEWRKLLHSKQILAKILLQDLFPTFPKLIRTSKSIFNLIMCTISVRYEFSSLSQDTLMKKSF